MTGAFANDLVVVIPGILGTRLVRMHRGEPRPVWDLRLRSLPRTLRELSRLASSGTPDPAVDDGVRIGGLIRDPRWLPDLVGVEGYSGLMAALTGRLGDRVVAFPYDWRLSNRVAAERLGQTVLPLLTQWRRGAGGQHAKLVLVCHSMGGLVARYFCEQFGGAEVTRRITTFGTPHRGSLKALQMLVNGPRYGPLDLRAIARTLPSVYELLPQYPCLIDAGGSRHKIMETPLADLDADRVRGAMAFWDGIRAPAEQRKRTGVGCPYEQQVMFGRCQPTPQFAAVDRTGIRVLAPGVGSPDLGGDGTVPAFSAFPIELDDTRGGWPLLDKHAAMHARRSAVELLMNELSPMDISGLRAAEAQQDQADIEGSGITLDVPNLRLPGEPVPVTVIGPDARPVLDVHDHERSRRTTEVCSPIRGRQDPRGRVSGVVLGPLLPGAYTVTVRGPRPVRDNVLVVDAAD